MDNFNKNILDLVAKDDFDSVIKLLLSNNANQIEEENARKIAGIFITPSLDGSMQVINDESRRRLDCLLQMEDERVLKILLASLEFSRGWHVRQVVRYICHHDKSLYIFEGLEQGRYSKTREYIFESLIFVDWLVGNGRLPWIFGLLDKNELETNETTAILGSLLALTVYDRLFDCYQAPSGVTGDTSLILDAFRRANNDNDIKPFTRRFDISYGEPPTQFLDNALVDLLTSKCEEEEILTTITKCSSFNAIDILCRVLERIGTESSLNTLKNIPLNIDAQRAVTVTTRNPVSITAHAICERLDIPTLQKYASGEEGIIKEISSQELLKRQNFSE